MRNIGYTRHRTKGNKNNPEKLATWGTQDEDKQNKNKPETGGTLGTQDTGLRETKQGAIKNGQSRDMRNIGYTRHRTKGNKTRGNQEWTIQRHEEHWVHKTQD
jgi:hypothetical protein